LQKVTPLNALAEFSGQTLKLPLLRDMRLRAKGAFEGYASLFGVEDQGRDVVMPGAFRASLTRRATGDIRMLFQHDPAQPVGVWDEIREDAHGLYVRGRLIEEVERARELLALMRAGALDGLSIGFRVRKAMRDARTGQRRLHEIDLWEISIVTFPMLPGARVSRVKSGATPAHSALGTGSPGDRRTYTDSGHDRQRSWPIPSARPQLALAASSQACSVRPSGAIGSRNALPSPARRETRPGGGLPLR
jgi:HK97 family phage prohead protease